MSYTSYTEGDQVKIVHADRFDKGVKEGDIFQVTSVDPGGMFPETIEIYPVESEYEGDSQISFKHWIEPIT